MGPRYTPDLKRLTQMFREVPAGTSWSYLLGSHACGCVRYDGAVWSLHPMLTDKPARDAAYEEALSPTGSGHWMPESEERYRTIIGDAHCSHSDLDQFILLLAEGNYGVSHGYWSPTPEEIAACPDLTETIKDFPAVPRSS